MNHQPAPINPPLDQKNEEPQKETEAKRSNISSQESSESSMDGNEEELNADGVKKLRKTKQKKHDKRQKKSSKITNVTDQEMVDPTSKASDNCDNGEGWKTAGKTKGHKKDLKSNLSTANRGQEDAKLSYNVHFHVFVPPEFEIDLNKCQFGLISSLNEFSEKQMHAFQSKPLDTGGFLVTGTFKKKNNKQF